MPQSEFEDVENRVAGLEEQGGRITRALELLAERSATPAVRAGRNWDAYAAVIATAIGLLALVVAAYTAYVQRQQLRGQVWPHLEIGSGNLAPALGFRVTNGGTGPALVTAVRVTVNKKPVARWWDAQQQVGAESGGIIYDSLSGKVLPPGKEIKMIRPFGETTTPQFEELFKHAIVVTACYCSVLDECWVVTSEAGGAVVDPEPCPIPEAERFKD